jgi:nucleotide-binding universal stress UspA family protein
MSQGSGLIVVGVEGSSEGDGALRFAVEEAARCGDAVEVVTAWHVDLPPLSYPTLPQAGTLPSRGELREHAKEAQQQALARASVPAGTPVSCEVVEGLPGQRLVEAARTARLLVVGSRAIGPIRAALLGSVSRYCAHHASCPVVVVPDATRTAGAREGAALIGARTRANA